MDNKVKTPIYLVSLKQDSKRRDELKRNFHSTYDYFQYIEGVDGRELYAKDYFEKTQGFFKKNKHMLLPGELGCSLSHIKVLECFLESKEEFCIILEDDVIGSDRDIIMIDNILTSLSKGGKILFFWGMHKTPYMRYQVGLPKKKNYYCVNQFSYPYLYGTFAYSVNREMARDIIYMHKKFIVRADDWGVLLSRKKQILVLFKNILKHPENMINSHIDSERMANKKPFFYRFITYSGLFVLIKRAYMEFLTFILILLGNRRLK